MDIKPITAWHYIFKIKGDVQLKNVLEISKTVNLKSKNGN